jgi:hypothetical protein
MSTLTGTTGPSHSRRRGPTRPSPPGARLDAVARAEARLAAGSYGKSVKSGLPIPDERLEADPAAELTVEEAAARR